MSPSLMSYQNWYETNEQAVNTLNYQLSHDCVVADMLYDYGFHFCFEPMGSTIALAILEE